MVKAIEISKPNYVYHLQFKVFQKQVLMRLILLSIQIL